MVRREPRGRPPSSHSSARLISPSSSSRWIGGTRCTNRRTNPDLIQLPEEGLDLEAYLESIRTQLMVQALERTDGIQTQAAELLGMSFRSFRYYAKKAGITGGD